MKTAVQRKMKPSGIDWIGDVPEEWQARRIKYLVGGEGTLFMDGDWINSDIIVDDGVRYLTSGNVGVGAFKRQGNGHITNETFKELNCLKALPGDLMLCRLNEPLGRGCIIPDDEHYYVVAVDNVILRPEKDYDKRYIMYCVSCDRFSAAALIAASGATMQRISRNDLGRLSIPVPPLDEQRRIAAKLDRLCGRVDELTENLKGEIAALQEYRKSLITECVTKGLGGTRSGASGKGDADAQERVPPKMKPSGVDWIGDVPEEWTVMRTKYVSRVQTGPFGTQLSAESYTEDGSGVPCVNVKNIGDGVFRVDDLDRIQKDVAERLVNYGIKRGDVIFARKGSVDKRTVAEDEQDGWILGSDSIGVRFDEDVLPRYACYYYGNGVMGQHLHKMAKGSTMPSMNAEIIGNLEIIIPPFVEQCRIAALLDERCAVIDAKIAEWQRQLEKLGEYRSSVIYEYVTGKKEVAA